MLPSIPEAEMAFTIVANAEETLDETLAEPLKNIVVASVVVVVFVVVVVLVVVVVFVVVVVLVLVEVLVMVVLVLVVLLVLMDVEVVVWVVLVLVVVVLVAVVVLVLVVLVMLVLVLVLVVVVLVLVVLVVDVVVLKMLVVIELVVLVVVVVFELVEVATVVVVVVVVLLVVVVVVVVSVVLVVDVVFILVDVDVVLVVLLVVLVVLDVLVVLVVLVVFVLELVSVLVVLVVVLAVDDVVVELVVLVVFVDVLVMFIVVVVVVVGKRACNPCCKNKLPFSMNVLPFPKCNVTFSSRSSPSADTKTALFKEKLPFGSKALALGRTRHGSKGGSSTVTLRLPFTQMRLSCIVNRLASVSFVALVMLPTGPSFASWVATTLTNYMTVVPLSGQVANIWKNTKKIVFDGSKIHTQKNVKTMLLDGPEAIETLFKHYFLSMSMAYPSGQPATICLPFFEYVFLAHPNHFLIIF